MRVSRNTGTPLNYRHARLSACCWLEVCFPLPFLDQPDLLRVIDFSFTAWVDRFRTSSFHKLRASAIDVSGRSFARLSDSYIAVSIQECLILKGLVSLNKLSASPRIFMWAFKIPGGQSWWKRSNSGMNLT